MKNTSIKQLNEEVATAKRQALREPHRFERPDEGLTDFLAVRPMQSGKQTLSKGLKLKIERLFDKFPVQYKYLGLYFAAGFTIEEIADLEGVDTRSARTTLSRSKDRLRKGLTDLEFESIAWAVNGRNYLEATPTDPETVARKARHKAFVADQPVRRGYQIGHTIYWEDGGMDNPDNVNRPIQGLHPDPKILPVPRHVLLDEATPE